MSMEDYLDTVKLYREVMTSLNGPPLSNKKCYAVEINWMRKFLRFGKACEELEARVNNFNVSYYYKGGWLVVLLTR
jgi:hypothetical protein